MDERLEAVARTLWDQDRADGKESCSWEEACETSTTTRDYFLNFAERVLAALDERERLSKDTHNPFGDECSCRDDHASWCRHNPAWAKFPDEPRAKQRFKAARPCELDGCPRGCDVRAGERCPRKKKPCERNRELETCTCRKPPEGMIGWDRGMIDAACPLHGHDALPPSDFKPLIDAVKGPDGEDAREWILEWRQEWHVEDGRLSVLEGVPGTRVTVVPKSTRDERDREIERLQREKDEEERVWRKVVASEEKRARHAETQIKELKQRLFIAQGEAYLGLLDGDDTPDPRTACQNVIDALLAAEENEHLCAEERVTELQEALRECADTLANQWAHWVAIAPILKAIKFPDTPDETVWTKYIKRATTRALKGSKRAEATLASSSKEK